MGRDWTGPVGISEQCGARHSECGAMGPKCSEGPKGAPGKYLRPVRFLQHSEVYYSMLQHACAVGASVCDVTAV